MDRRLIEVSGEDALSFLQGLATNDLRPLETADGIVHAALLSPQGKYLADFFVIRRDGRLLLDMPEALAEATLKRLAMYRLRAKVAFAPFAGAVTRGLGTPPAQALPDPRHPALGWRLYGQPQPEAAVDWDAIRVAHCIPEAGAELIPDDSYILEHGLERLHGVDFRKGCYVGQEVTARMKHKTELRKGLIRVAVNGAAPVGTPITDAQGREVGRLFTQSGGFGLAHLRLDRLDGPLLAGTAEVRPA